MVMIDNAQKDVKIFKKSLKIPKGVIRIRNSKTNRQHNDQQKKDKRTNNVLQNICIFAINGNYISTLNTVHGTHFKIVNETDFDSKNICIPHI
jgi:hypothetical protein